MGGKAMLLSVGLLVFAIFAGFHHGWSQEKPLALSIAVIDMQSLMQNSAAGKNLRSQVDKVRADHQQKVKGEQEEMAKIFQSIAKERSTLSQGTYQQRLEELQQKAANYDNEVQERQGKLEAAVAVASQKIAAAIARTVDEVMKEQKLALVLPRSLTIGTPAVPDITQEVLKRLNKRVPVVTMDLPK